MVTVAKSAGGSKSQNVKYNASANLYFATRLQQDGHGHEIGVIWSRYSVIMAVKLQPHRSPPSTVNTKLRSELLCLVTVQIKGEHERQTRFFV